MCAMRVMPVNDDILKTKVDPRKVIALYGNFNELKINVGYPAIAAYKPILGNMWGYKEASEKGLYIILDEGYEDNESDIYEIDIDTNRNVLTQFNKVVKIEESKVDDTIEVEAPIYIFDLSKKKKKSNKKRAF